MPTYDYICSKCENKWDVVKPMSEYKTEEKCPHCQWPGDKQFSRKIHLSGTKIEDAEYNPALGKITKSKYHREELAKRMGCVEVGNDFKKPELMQRHFDDARADKRRKRWEED